tara:strand:- start:3311 stop:3451 length:141 start_codon:yes stop_codon:yes gene_type:complete
MKIIRKFFKDSKIGKYIITGSFFFFLFKGIVWIILITLAWFGMGKI